MTVTFKGRPMTLVGPELKAGEPAPELWLVSGDLQTVDLNAVTQQGAKNAYGDVMAAASRVSSAVNA